MSCLTNSTINETFIILPAGDVLSGCTGYFNNILSCTDNTQIYLGNNSIILSGNVYTDYISGNTIVANNYYGNGSFLTGITDTYVTGMTFNNANYNLTLNRNDGVSLIQNLGILATDVTITGGTYSPTTGNVIFTNNTGGTFTVSGFLTGYTDTYVTGATYNITTGIATFTNTTGGTFNISGFSRNNLISLTMPSAFSVVNSPLTTGGTIVVNVTGATNQFIDGTGSLQSNNNLTLARNPSSYTQGILTKGTIVLISGSTGNRPNIKKAIANSETTSARTFGVVLDDIAVNTDGYVLAFGQINDLDTRTNATNPFTTDTLVDGDVIYLSPTNAGYVTNVKPSAPNHMVYIGTVLRTSPTLGTIDYRIQNGFELQELHNVAISGVTNRDILQYNSTNQLWENKNSPIFTSLSTSTISASTFIGLPLDVYTTGATISGQSMIFTNNSGGTFTVSGFDTFATGFTYDNANTLSLQRNQDQRPLTVTIDTMTGLTINGVLEVSGATSTLTNNTIRQNVLSINTIRTDNIVNAGTVNERLVQINGTRTLTNTGSTLNVYGLHLINNITNTGSPSVSNFFGIGQTGTMTNMIANSNYFNFVGGSHQINSDNASVGGFEYNPTLSKGSAISLLGSSSDSTPHFAFRNRATYNGGGIDGSSFSFIDSPTSTLRTIANSYSFGARPTFNLTSGTNIYNGFFGQPTFNGPNAGSITIRGFYWNPSLTIGTTLVHNAIETVSGNVVLGTTSGNVLIGTSTNAGYRLDVSGKTRFIDSSFVNNAASFVFTNNQTIPNITSQIFKGFQFNGTIIDGNSSNNTTSNIFSFEHTYRLAAGVITSANQLSYLKISPTFTMISNGDYGGTNIIDLSHSVTTPTRNSTTTAILIAPTLATSGGSINHTGVFYNPVTTSGSHTAFRNTIGNNLLNTSGGITVIGTTTTSGYKLDVSGSSRTYNNNLTGSTLAIHTITGATGTGTGTTSGTYKALEVGLNDTSTLGSKQIRGLEINVGGIGQLIFNTQGTTSLTTALSTPSLIVNRIGSSGVSRIGFAGTFQGVPNITAGIQWNTSGQFTVGSLLTDNGYTSINANGAEVVRVSGTSSSFNTTNATANVVIGGGSATASSAPLKILSGATMTTPETGAIEYDGTNYYVTPSTIRYRVIGNGIPTISGGTGAGTSPTLTVSGNDGAMQVSILTGAAPVAGAVVGTVTFNKAFGSSPKVIFSPANAATALLSGASMVYMDTNGSTTTFTINAGSVALITLTTYLWNISVCQ
jgi:hypothetical protein